MPKRWNVLILAVAAAGALAIGAAFLGPETWARWRGMEGAAPRQISARTQADPNDSNFVANSQPSSSPEVAGLDGDRPTPGQFRPAGAGNPDPRMTVLVPAYFYPEGKALDDWERIFRGASKAPLTVIVNPNSGPGDEVDPNYLAVIRRAVASRITIVGYVDTGYAKRPEAEVRADIEKWIRFYPVIGGIFLDSQATGAEHLAYYAGLRAFVAEKIDRGIVITNPGTVCALEYFTRGATDVACVFSAEENFANFRLPPTWRGLFRSRNFAAIPYGIEDENSMKGAVLQAAQGHIGYIYVSDAKTPNLWGRLPHYWEAEVEAVRRVNQRQTP